MGMGKYVPTPEVKVEKSEHELLAAAHSVGVLLHHAAHTVSSDPHSTLSAHSRAKLDQAIDAWHDYCIENAKSAI